MPQPSRPTDNPQFESKNSTSPATDKNDGFNWDALLGITNLTIINLVNPSSELNKPTLFSRYGTIKDPLYRIASIINGPLAGLFIVLRFTGFTLKMVGTAILELTEGEIEDAQNSLLEAGKGFLFTLFAIIGAALSPLLNALDLIGGLVHTCIPEQQKGSALGCP